MSNDDGYPHLSGHGTEDLAAIRAWFATHDAITGRPVVMEIVRMVVRTEGGPVVECRMAGELEDHFEIPARLAQPYLAARLAADALQEAIVMHIRERGLRIQSAEA